MFMILMVLASAMIAAMIWPDLPFSRSLVSGLARLASRLSAKASTGRAIIAVGLALFLFAAIWALQGDAPMVLAMALPEIAGWLATFEIATLVEAAVTIAATFVAVRASGLSAAIKARSRSPRQRKPVSDRSTSANDDERGGWALAA